MIETVSSLSARWSVGNRSSARWITYPLALKLSAYFTKSGVAKSNVSVVPQFQVHFSLDQAIGTIDPDQHDKRNLFPHRCLDLLRVHKKAPIARHGQHFACRLGKLGTNGSRQRKGHCGEPIGNEAGVWLICWVKTSHPHLEGTSIDWD
jgi:hypothetical protein